MHARILLFLFLASLLGGLAARGNEDEDDGPIVKKMKACKAAGRTVSQGFKQSDKERVIDGATQLIKAMEGLGALYPVKDDEKGAKDFQARADAVTKASQEFIESVKKAKDRDPKAQEQLKDGYMKSVRGACLSCHNEYWLSYECENSKQQEKWTQPKWEEKHCRVCGKPGCGKPVENEEED